MDRAALKAILENYGIKDITQYQENDSTKDVDFRLNIFIDGKYVLRINDAVITEERLASISRLCERYREIGVATPRLYKNLSGRYLTPWEGRVCYLSDYLEGQTEREAQDSCNHEQVRREVLRSIGLLSRKYSGCDLSPVNSMWSIIDLAPLDVDIDEKQDNLNTLVEALHKLGESELAQKVSEFNRAKRERIKAVYKRLPRCVIQGDLNWSNIMVENDHFAGLIDFNMAGTEVNINHFCAETNGGIPEEDFDRKTAGELYNEWRFRQDSDLEIVLREYPLNQLEADTIDDYRSIVLISQYPNVTAFLEFLERNREKAVQLIQLILHR